MASVYSIMVALFVYRDMGPLQDKPWVEESDSPEAKVGFSAIVYGISFFMVWMIMSFFAYGGSEDSSAANRAIWGALFAFSIVCCVLILER